MADQSQPLPAGLVIESIGGMCPCQAVGTMFGRPFYFWARYGEWTLDVVEMGHDPVLPEAPILHLEGDDPDDGYMPPENAMVHVLAAFEAMKGKGHA